MLIIYNEIKSQRKNALWGSDFIFVYSLSHILTCANRAQNKQNTTKKPRQKLTWLIIEYKGR